MALQTTNDNAIVKAFGSCYKDIIGSDVLKAVITAFFTAFFASRIGIASCRPCLARQDLQ
jgi:hypothetical protein